MQTFDLGDLPRLLTDQSDGIDDETPADRLIRARHLDVLFVALLPVGMRVVCLDTVGIVTGWDTAPVGNPRRVPYFSRSVPHAFAPEQGFSPASSTYLPALRAHVIVDTATIPHLCKVIAESYGRTPALGESFGIRREGGRWSILSTHGWRWDLDFTPRNFPASPEAAVIATLTARLEEIVAVYYGREPERIG